MVVEGLIRAQLDFQLIEYYKLLVQSHIQSRNVEAANQALSSLYSLIRMRQDADAAARSRDIRTAEQLLEDMENWTVEIDLSSVQLPNNRLIPKEVANKFRK